MRTDKECGHADKSYCGGFLTDTEFEMARLRPSQSADEYHDILMTFEKAFDGLEEGRGNTEPTGSDQEDR